MLALDVVQCCGYVVHSTVWDDQRSLWEMAYWIRHPSHAYFLDTYTSVHSSNAVSAKLYVQGNPSGRRLVGMAYDERGWMSVIGYSRC